MPELKSFSYFFWLRLLLGAWVLAFFAEALVFLDRFAYLAKLFSGVDAILFAVFMCVGFVASLAFLIGVQVRLSALTALIAMQFLIQAIPRFRIVPLPYISILLLVMTLFYQSSGLLGSRARLTDRKIWYLPLLLGIYAGFSVSGLSKLFFEPWKTGAMIGGQCELSMISSVMGPTFCNQLPREAMAYGIAWIEILSFPLALFPQTRPMIWLVSTILHLGTVFFVPQFPTRNGVFITQLFLFDPEWIRHRSFAFLHKLGSN